MFMFKVNNKYNRTKTLAFRIFDSIRHHFGCNYLGTIFLVGSCMGGNCPGVNCLRDNCPRWELSGGNWHRWHLSEGNCPRWQFSGGQLSRGQLTRGELLCSCKTWQNKTVYNDHWCCF